MCGRYTLTVSLKTLQKRFVFNMPELELAPRYNIAPSQDVPVVINEGRLRELALFHWGLIPSWAKDASIGSRMINARGESLLEKTSFKGSFKKRRCLVLADGFYEWKHEWKQKTPIRITMQSGEPFAMAGIWDAWKTPQGREVRSFTIVTTSAADAIRPIHDRMPVILGTDAEEEWLDPKSDAAQLLRFIKPSAERLSTTMASKLVNSPANDKPECLSPAPEEGPSQGLLF